MKVFKPPTSKGTEMRKYFAIIGFVSLMALNAVAAEAQAESCEQIREQIKAQTGLLPKADTDLLQKLSARSECRFSAAEVYRAAYGDKPLPKTEQRGRQSKHDDDD
jgi:hypothetical protein